MISDRVDSIVEDLSMFDEDIDKYEYIIDLGKAMKPLDDFLLRDEFLVKGCSSKVWLISEYLNGIVKYSADSNSVIVKGLISILIYLFNGLSPMEILEYDFNGLKELNLTEIISPTRQNGVYHMVNKIKHYAEIYKDT